MNNTREQFQGMIRRILKEEIEKRDGLVSRLPEMSGNGVDKVKKKNKTFASSENPRDTNTNDQLLDELRKIVREIDISFRVVWDDHDDLKIDARDLISLRITPDWEDHYEIETMIRNEDRIWVTGLDWDQVKEFVKTNVSGIAKKPTGVEKAYDKSYRNSKDQTQASKKEGQKSNPVKEKKVGDSSNKEKDFNKSQNAEEDNPDKPMKEVGEFKRQGDFKVKEPVKIRKKTPDKKLVVKPK
jgi:hypothetical protein